MLRTFLGGFCLLASALICGAEDLASILQRMNAQAPTLHSMTADIQMLTYTKVIDDKITEDGVLKMQKSKNGAIRAVVDFSGLKDSSREIGFFGRIVRIYYPNAKYYQDYEVGKNGNLLNQFLLLGFGSSGDELAKSYTISPEGMDKIVGISSTKLLLIPNDPKVKEHLARVEIWIPEGQSNPIQQQFYEEPSGNYRKVTYSNMKINPSIKGALEIQIPAGIEKRQ
jgi:outer membrane lipoprotein-sorting protein